MATRPSLSITLPRNFTFHYNDNDVPTTPAPQTKQPDSQYVVGPPPPPRQTFKVRRRKLPTAPPRDIIAEIHSDSLPTIEMTESDINMEGPCDPEYMPGYLAPQLMRPSFISPPRTPLNQMATSFPEIKSHQWSGDRSRAFNDIESDDTVQPASPSFSDSSVSSFSGSLRSVPSFENFHANSSSPDSEPSDPFRFPDIRSSRPILSPQTFQTSPSAKRAKTEKEARWTPEMDHHLWLTYQKYIEDPELTPFKMLPGTAPPLGVCGKVAREAKHSWKGMKHAKSRPSILQRNDLTRDRFRTWSHWPCTESGTRKRLRKLCKQSPSLSAHYQRLITTRSPSPFESSSSSPRLRSDLHPPAFLDVDQTRPKLSSSSSQPIVGRIGRSQAHQKSQSLQLAIGGNDGQNNHHMSLYFNSPPRSKHFNSFSHSRGGSFVVPPPPASSSLDSPVEFNEGITSRKSLKRRHNMDDHSQSNSLENLFNQVPNISRPKRDRSFSLGAVFDSTRKLSLTFEGRDIPEEESADIEPMMKPNKGLRLMHDPVRLGSPFAGSIYSSSTCPRNFTPFGSGSSFARPNLSLEGRFRELAAQNLRQANDNNSDHAQHC